MSGGPYCAHLSVKYDPIDNKNGTMSDRWTCAMCKGEFWPRHWLFPAPWLVSEYERGRRDGLEQAAQECDRHAKFCHDEAHRGGDFTNLIARSTEATYNAERIRKLAATSGTPAPSDDDLLKEIKETFVLSSTNQIAQAILTIIRRTAAPRQIFPTPNGLASAEIITTTGAAPPADETLPAGELQCTGPFSDARDCPVHAKDVRGTPAQPSGAQGEGLTCERLQEWWEAIHHHLENPSTPSGIPCDPPKLKGCTQDIWEALEYMDRKTFLRAETLLSALAAAREPAAPTEQSNWKGVKWRDSIKARDLAEEISLHFAHDCNDSECGEDADESNCETAWIETKLTGWLDEMAAPASGTEGRK